MATFAEVQEKVQNRIIDLPSTVTAEVPDLINAAMRDLMDVHNFKVMEAYTDFTTDVDAADPQLVMTVDPDVFKEFRGKPSVVPDTGRPQRIAIAPSFEAIYQERDPDTTGSPRYLVETEPADENGTRYIKLFPTPDGLSDYTDGEYRIRLPYWKYLTALSDDSDENWFTNNYLTRNYLIDKATSLGFGLDWDSLNEDRWELRAEKWKLKAISADKLLRMGGVRTLVPHYRGANEPMLGDYET